jgi:hypothetical protein
MGDTMRRVTGSVVVALSLASMPACTGDDPPRPASSHVADPVGDVERGVAESKAGRPPGIDLVTVVVARDREALSFTADVVDEGDVRATQERLWTLRLRKPGGALLYMLYAGDLPNGGLHVMVCPHTRFCSDRVEDATIDAKPQTIHVRVPLDRLPKLPDTFEWEASASAALTANIDDNWNDFAPTTVLRPPSD